MTTARWLMACAVLFIATPPQMAQLAAPDARTIKEDVDALVRYVAENYAYFDQKAIAWSSIPQLYGNTTVARAMLGRFVSRELPYQKHVRPSEARDTGVTRSWLEIVSPRGPFQYDRPVAVLVNHWTGSMGEELAIGFDATRAGVIAGTPMAGLLGATYRVERPHSRIGVNVPAEQLFHVNGTPREQFVPPVAVDPAAPSADDAWIAKALQALAR